MTKAVTPEIIEKIEAAAGPDRELDVLIAEHVAWQGDLVARARTWSPHNTTAALVADIEMDGYLRGLPAYTASIDAALTLVPEGAGLSIQRYWIAAVDGYVWSAGVSTGGVPSNPRKVFASYDAANAALAITAASLRARITQEQSNGKGHYGGGDAGG